MLNGSAEPLGDWAAEFLPHYFHRPASRMHRWLDERLAQMDPGARLAIVAPRNSAKSTWLSFAFPLRQALLGRERYILLVAETGDQARRYLRSIKQELESNHALRQAYPESAGAGGTWNVHRATLRNGVELEAIGTGSSIRGRKNAESRPTLVIVDDPQGRKHIASALLRRHQWTWFTQDLLNVGSPRTKYLVAGTALHREALVDRLLVQPGWEAKRFRAIERWPVAETLWHRWEELYTDRQRPQGRRRAWQFYCDHRAEMEAGAELLWPDHENLYFLMKLRVDIGRTAFESEKQGNPLNPELCEWPESYFSPEIWFNHWPQNLVVRSLALDPSKGRDAKVGDYSAYVLLGVSPDGLLYVEADVRRRAIEDMVQDGVAWIRQFQPDVFGCESNAWQELLGGEFEAAFRSAGMLDARPWPINNHESKLVRVRRLGPFLSQRRLRFKSGSAGTSLLVDQLKDFPVGEHDDGPDALEMAIRLANGLLADHQADGLGDRLPIERD